MIYSEQIIKSNKRLPNLSVSIIKNLLDLRYKNLIDSNFSMYYEDLETITAVDHFICKKILNNDPITPGKNFDIYLKEISKQMHTDPFFLFTLPISEMDFTILEKYIPDINTIWDECKKKRATIRVYENEFDDYINGIGPEPKKENIMEIVKFYNYIALNRKFSGRIVERQGEIVKYILSKGSTYGYKTLSFITKYLGLKKCKELGLDDTQILIGNLQSLNYYGLSKDSNCIVISKDLLQHQKFVDDRLKDMVTGNIKAEDKQYIEGKLYRSGFNLLMVLFHELRHQEQLKSMRNHENIDISYMYASTDIIATDDADEYNRNYWSYEIENDANINGWLDVINNVDSFFTNEKDPYANGIKDCIRGFMISKVCTKSNVDYRVDKSGKKRFTSGYINSQLDKYFKDNPQSLSGEFQQFLKYYHADGSPKSAFELLELDVGFNEQNYYLGQVISRITNKDTNDLSILSEPHSQLSDQINAIKNINFIIYLLYSKLSRVKEYKTYHDVLKVPQIETSDVNVIRNNSIKYFKTAQYFANIVKKMLSNNPQLISYVDYYVTSESNGINTFLKKINSNDMIREYLGDSVIEEIDPQSMYSSQKIGGL